MKRLLIQTQLSNYDSNGKFILECDSGYQMVMGRVREMLKLNPRLSIDVMGPLKTQLITQPECINPELFQSGRLGYVEHFIVPNALATRYDFNYANISNVLNLRSHLSNPDLRYDAVYINDPMHLRNLKALFYLSGYSPKFYVHSHFIDNPSCPKFPTEASLWLGQCEAAMSADYNFWQCGSAMEIFFKEMSNLYVKDTVNLVRQKSMPWDDGYSIEEITQKPNMNNVRINTTQFLESIKDKLVIFVPNRIGKTGISSDYTNCGKFMFEILPELRKIRQDFVVIAGNPNQKISNQQLQECCQKNGYLNLVPNSFNRDEFKFVASHCDIAVGLYDQDSYGGTAARECVELGMFPLWIDNYEYNSLAKEAGLQDYLASSDFSNIVITANKIMTDLRKNKSSMSLKQKSLKNIVANRCSYEKTTLEAMSKMNLLSEDSI